MRRAVLGTKTVQRSGMLLAFLAVVAVGPRFARAGCSSHYTAERSAALGLTAQLDLLGAFEAPASPLNEAPRPLPAPCTGPSCSGAPSPPASSTTPDVSAGADQWAMSSAHTPLADPERSDRSCSDPRFPPEDRPCSIFHPPRSSGRPHVAE